MSYPKHVNHELSPMGCPAHLDEVDLFGEGAQEHWYEAYEILHRDAPVLRIEGGGHTPGSDAFVLSKHADVSRVIKDPDRFLSLTTKRVGALAEQGLSPEEAYASVQNLMTASMVSLRPTQQLYNRHRKELTDPWVGPGALRHRDMIAKHANDLLDEWIDDDQVEFISQFARPLPQRVMASILGFPLSDIPLLAEWGDAVVTPFVHGDGLRHDVGPGPNRRDDCSPCRFPGLHLRTRHRQTQRPARRHGQLPLRRALRGARPQAHRHRNRRHRPRDDHRWPRDHAVRTRGTSAAAVREPGHLRAAANRPRPSCARSSKKACGCARRPTACRLASLPTTRSSRASTCQRVRCCHLRFGAANVDEHEFDCPFDLDLDREAVTRHVTFSAGPRVCPGATLSRVEQQIAWGVLLDRSSRSSTAPTTTGCTNPGIMLGTLKLNLDFRKAASPLSLGTGRNTSRD